MSPRTPRPTGSPCGAVRASECLHYHFYFDDDRFGLAQVRLQTWFPFHANVVLNGREWLARQLDNKGIGYQRRDNCFTWVEDFTRAQKLAGQRPRTHGEAELDRLLRRVLPPRRLWLPDDHYYWPADQAEWATYLAFRDADTLAELDPQLIRRGIETFRSEDVLRFLGHRVTAEGRVPARFAAEVTSDLKHRPEGCGSSTARARTRSSSTTSQGRCSGSRRRSMSQRAQELPDGGRRPGGPAHLAADLQKLTSAA